MVEKISRLPAANVGRGNGNGEPDFELKTRACILKNAHAITYGDRERDYGNPVANFESIARIFEQILPEDDITWAEASILNQIATKLGRMKASPLKADHYIDLVNYTAILYELRVAQERRKKLGSDT